MHIPKHLPQIQYGYDYDLTTITYDLIGGAIGYLFYYCFLILNSNLRSTNNKNYKFSKKFKIKCLLLSPFIKL